MFNNSLAVIKLTVLSCAAVLITFISTSQAQVSAPRNLKVDVDSLEATLSWDEPGKGTAVQYYVYKAYTSSVSNNPSNLHFTKFDSTFSRYYTDDLSSAAADNPIVFYYVTAEDSNKVESPKSNFVNAAAPQNGNPAK